MSALGKWFLRRLGLLVLLFLTSSRSCLGQTNGSGEMDMEEQTHEACVTKLTPILKDACGAATDSRDNLAIWTALIKITRDCQLDDPSTSQSDAVTVAGGNATTSTNTSPTTTPTPTGATTTVTSNGTANNTSLDAYGTFWLASAMRTFQSFLADFNNATGLNVDFKRRTISDYIKSWLEVEPNSSHPGPNDWWMVGGEIFGEYVGKDHFVEMTSVLANDPSYRLTDIPATFRDVGSSAFAGSYSALPLWLTAYQLMYRRDIFASYGISVPHTWDEAIQVAEKYGKGQLGPGQPDLGFCFEANPDCGYAHAALMYIVGTMVQYKGASHGTWFDPDDLQPLYTHPEVLREALRIFRALQQHSLPDDTPCAASYNMLASGRCLMLWGFAYAFKRASHNSSAMWGRQGVTWTPGSARVLDRRTGTLVPCSTALCPYGMRAVDAATGQPTVINHIIPIDTGSFAINAHAPLHRQAAAFAVLHTFTGPQEHMAVMLEPTSEFTPMRYSELEEAAWVAAGYHPEDVRGFLQFFNESFDRQNMYYELRIPGVYKIYVTINTLVQLALARNRTFEELLSYVAVRTEEILHEYGGRQRLLPLYQRSVGYEPAPPPSPSSGGGGGSSSETIVVAALVPTLAILVLAAAALWGALRWNRARRERRERLQAAPGPGSGTTLLVTDIQDSTCLWETLPAEVMDAAVKLHHRTVRELLIKHHGYESATEGDSFILAFHTPDRALGFSLAAQDAFLTASWPQQLLHSPYATTVLVHHNIAAAAPYASCVTSPVLRSTLMSGDGAVGTSLYGSNGGLPPPLPHLSPERPPTPSERETPRLLASPLGAPTGWSRKRLSYDGGGVAERSLLPSAPPPPRTVDGVAWTAVGPSGARASAPLGAPDDHQQADEPRASDYGLPSRRRSMGSRSSKRLPGRPPATALHPQVLAEADSRGSSGGGGAVGGLAWRVLGRRNTVSGVPPKMAAAALSGRGGGDEASSCGEEAPSVSITGVEGCAEDGGGGDGGGGEPCATTLQEALATVFPPATAPVALSPLGPHGGALLLFRGLRVRIGLHCGLGSAAEVQYNRASGRVMYPGATLQLAKAVSDVGRGGQITITTRVLRAVNVKGGGTAYVGPYVVLGGGLHVVKEGNAPEELHLVFSRGLLARAGHMERPRSVQVKIPGVLDAPLGRVAVALVQVQDADEFAGWGLECSLDNHRGLLRHAGSLACRNGGYLVATPPGSFQAVFTRPALAVQWLLQLQDELGPPNDTASPATGTGATKGMVTGSAKTKAKGTGSGRAAHGLRDSCPGESPLPSLSNTRSSNTSGDTRDVANMLQRAMAIAQLSILQVKGGVDVGEAAAALRDGGDMSYSGAAVKRAACLAAHAQWHEVLVSLDVARSIVGESHPAVLAMRTASRKGRPASRRKQGTGSGMLPALTGTASGRLTVTTPATSITTTCPRAFSAEPAAAAGSGVNVGGVSGGGDAVAEDRTPSSTLPVVHRLMPPLAVLRSPAALEAVTAAAASDSAQPLVLGDEESDIINATVEVLRRRSLGGREVQLAAPPPLVPSLPPILPAHLFSTEDLQLSLLPPPPLSPPAPSVPLPQPQQLQQPQLQPQEQLGGVYVQPPPPQQPQQLEHLSSQAGVAAAAAAAAAGLAFSTDVRAIKFKGVAILACCVRLAAGHRGHA